MNTFQRLKRPLAITMWDFSWLERRWPGAGYEDWDLALDELAERGYDAVRIDAYPHLLSVDPHKTWELLPEWSVQDWGSPARNRVQVQPALNEFISKCGARGIKVGLSTWFRQDVDDVRMNIANGTTLGRMWVNVLDSIKAAGLMEHIVYVDLCNEWPHPAWAPFYKKTGDSVQWRNPHCIEWMEDSVKVVRDAYPDMAFTYSLWPDDEMGPTDLQFLDFLDPHIWMVSVLEAGFYEKVGYNFERFDSKGYDNVARHAEALYRSNPEYWQKVLCRHIEKQAALSCKSGHPLITTECWGIIDYKDWPLLDWEWVKELCAIGTETAAKTGRWSAIATSNFCGPQFRGMWRDIAWHQRLTKLIHEAAMPTANLNRIS